MPEDFRVLVLAGILNVIRDTPAPSWVLRSAAMSSTQSMIAALASWPTDPAPLIGVFESRELEFKKTAYLLTSNAQKAEFAKDIAGLANAGGGLIILGVETERDPIAGRDRSKQLRPLASGSINIPQMEAVARDWLYPPQRELDIMEWPDTAGNLLVSILVPQHDDPGGLVLSLGPGNPPDRRTIGIPVRSQSRVDAHTASEIYDWVRRGRFRTEVIDSELAPAVDGSADEQLERARSEFVETSPDPLAVFVLQAWPSIRTQLERIHDLDGVRGLFVNPPTQRYAGFGWWGLPPEVDSSGGIRVSSGRLALWITRGSVATLVVSQEYLTWAMDRYVSANARGPVINSIALGEFVFEFARMYTRVVEWAVPTPTQAWFRFAFFRALEPMPLQLGRGRADRIEYVIRATTPVADEFGDTLGPVDITGGDETAQRIAAQLLQRIYGMFGQGRDAIPHLADDGSRFDPTLL